MARLAAGLVFGLVLASSAALAADQPARITWYGIYAADGAALGHATHQVRAMGDGTEVIDTQTISIQENNAPRVDVSSRRVLTLDRSGKPVKISSRSQTGRQLVRSEAKLGDGKAVITRDAPSDHRVVTVALAPTVRFDGGEGLLAGWNPAAAPRIAFDLFDIDDMGVKHVVIEAAADGKSAIRRTYVGNDLRGVVKLSLSAGGEVTAVTQPMYGSTITIRPTDQQTAQKPHTPYRVLTNAMTKSLFRIPDPATQGRIRYRFSYRDGLRFPLPETGEQRVRAAEGGVAVDICADCGPGLATDAVSLAEARKPTPWMQSDHPRLMGVARPVFSQKITDSRKMELLREETKAWMIRTDFTGHYSALETLSRRSGDCTEAAVLLAALGRAAGIPTKVASGLVYSRQRYHGVSNVFAPHSWVLAFVDGRWRSYDAALDAFDSTHIAISVGDGDPRSMLAASQLASILVWEDMAEVRTRPP